MEKRTPSIKFLELFAFAVGVEKWAEDLKCKLVVVFVDNMSVVDMINQSNSSCQY